MTRETKIGLFVGMGVILLIGILISDHLSHSQRQDGAPLAEAGAVLQQQGAPSQPDSNAPPRLNTAMETNIAPPSTRDIVAPAPQPKLAAGVTGGGPVVLTQRLPAANNDGPAPLGAGVRLADSEHVNINPTDFQPAPGTAAKPVVHYVKSGDTLSAISQQYFGDHRHMQEIYEANRDKMSNINALRPGVRLVIPKAEKTDAPAPATTHETVGGAQKLALTDYTIREGDTFVSLAQKFYGSRGAWQKLYALNKERVPNPNRMKPGTVIQVPVRH